MALKSVVTDSFFDNLIVAFRAFQAQKGSLTCILLTSSPLSRATWDVTISAEWIDRMSPLKAAAEITQFLKQELVDDDMKLGLVRVRSTSDLLVQAVTADFDIPQLGTAYRVIDPDLDLFSIDEAVCLLSRPVRSLAPERVSA